MMAARAGARRVSSLEMVPALAAAARHIVAVNGFGSSIEIIQEKSSEMAATTGRRRACKLLRSFFEARRNAKMRTYAYKANGVFTDQDIGTERSATIDPAPCLEIFRACNKVPWYK